MFECTKEASYILWEHTQESNTLDLWYCAEDIARYFEKKDIMDRETVYATMNMNTYNSEYVAFVREIAYRLYVYSGCDDDLTNWYIAERLLTISEWLDALIKMASVYRIKNTD